MRDVHIEITPPVQKTPTLISQDQGFDVYNFIKQVIYFTIKVFTGRMGKLFLGVEYLLTQEENCTLHEV